MVDVNVDFILENEEPIDAEFVIEPDVTYTADILLSSASPFHNDLYNRDLPDQHPMSAITGLEDALDGLSDDIIAENNRAIEAEEALDDKIDLEETRAKGVEQDLASSIDSNHQAISNLSQNKVDKVSTANKVYGTDAQGNQTTYDKGSFGQVDDVKVAGVSVVTNKIANLGSMASETASDYLTSTQVANSIAVETNNRENADINLQSQIDAIVSASDVFDIVGTYAELQAYDISTVPVNDIIKVLVDSTHAGAATYYRCVETNNVKSWSYIGSEGAYYTKAEADSNFVPKTRTVNGKALSSDITLTANDVGALPSSTVIPTVNDGELDIQVNGTSIATFTANQSTNTTANIVVPDSATWGNVGGNIADQIDLMEALDAKQDLLTSENAGTDIEIVNGAGGDDTVSGNGSILLEKAVADGLNSVTISGGLKRSLLPDGYTQYDYISVNGDCYFITDYYPSNITEVKTKTFMHKQPTSPLVCRWTASPTNDTFGFYMGNVSGILTIFYGRYSDTKYLNIESVKLNMEHDIYMGVNSITFDGTSYSITRGTFTSTQPIYIGAFNQTGTSLAGMMYGRIYPVQFIEGGRTVKHYIPCKNSNGVIGLYEAISGTFISPASGTAKKGRPYINIDTIPDTYTRIEFLQSTGTQYIDSGVIANFANNKIEQSATVQYTTSDANRELMGTNGYGFWGKNASNKIEAALGQTTVNDNALVKNVISWTTNPDGNALILNVNSNQYTSTASTLADNNYAYYVFALGVRVDSGAAASFLCHAKVWDYTMAVDDEVVCYLLPVKRVSDNVLGMYDVVTGTFKTNAGTGTFTAGSNIALPSPSNPLPIVSNNGQLKLGSHGKNLFNKDGSPYLAGAYISSATVGQSTYSTTSNANYNVYRMEIKPNTTYTFGLIKASDPRWIVTDGSVILDAGTNGGGSAGTYKTITAGATAKYLYLSVAVTGSYKCDDVLQVEEGLEHTEYEAFHYILVAEGITETITDSANNTATAEMLLSIGDYTDTQEILSGAITRKVGVIVLNGTEDWTYESQYSRFYASFTPDTIANPVSRSIPAYCSHFEMLSNGEPFSGVTQGQGYLARTAGDRPSWVYLHSSLTSVAQFTQWLAQQYNAGTPVIIVYPLATETTETVTGQTLTTVQGDNTLSIQASIDNLPIEANYNMQGGTVINFTNDTGYITGINSTDVTNALGYTPVNPTSLATVATSGDYSDLSGTPTIPTTTNDLVNNSGFITNAVNDLTNYYTKSETYTQAEVQGLIANIPNFTVSVVQQLPQTGTDLVLYFVPKNGTSPDVYDEYIWVNNAYELIGSTQVDLSNYVTTSDLTTTLADYATENWVGQQGYLVNDDIVSREVVPSSKLFSNESANGYLETIRTYTLSDLFKVDIIQKCGYSGSNYYTGVKSPFLVLYKDADNYFGIERQGYKLRLINVVNGTAVNTEEWSTGVNSINTYLNIYLSLDLSNKKMKIVGSNGTPTTIYTFDFSSWSLSSLDTFKIRTSGGKYSGHQYNIYLRTNDYYDYESLLNLKFQVNSYNVLPIIADGEGNYTPTTLYIEGSNIVTTSDTHKTADVSISPLNYFMLSSGYDDLLDKYYVSSLVRFKITSGSAQIHAGVGITAFFLMDENSNILYNGIGASENYTLTNNTWYYLYIVGVGNQTYNYTRRYNAKFEGTFTIEAEALSIGYPRSMNCCAENFDGKYFSGAIPMVSDKTTFTEVAFAKTMNGYQAPIGAIVVDSGVMYIYNGTAWIDYSKFIVNKATGTDSLTIFGTAATANNAINIGATSSMAGGSYSVGIGYGAKCNSSNAVAIGRSASVGSNARDVTAIGYNARIASNADYAIQLGNGQNSTAKTLSVGFNTTNYQLLDGTTGLIPDARISSNIARASDIPTYTAGTGIDITSNTISVTAPTLTNTATGSDSLTILGTPITYDNGINIGKNTVAYGGSSVIIGGESRDSSTFAHADCVAIGYGANCQTYYSIAIGYEARTDDIEDVAIGYSTAIMENATKSVALGNYAAVGDGTTTIEGGTAIGSYSWANGEDATAIGHRAVASADSAVQIGYGTNNEANSFYVATSSSNNWKMLDSAGLIPDARISSNIARASDIPTIDQTYDGTSTNAQSGTAIAGLLEAIYPVGSVYIGTQATCPMSTVMSGTTWTLISSEKALWTGDGTNGGTTINAGLPDITGSITLRDSAQSQSDVDGAFAFDTTSSSGNWTGTNQQTRQYFKANFSASSSNAIYGASNTVQPPAYVVNVWERTA